MPDNDLGGTETIDHNEDFHHAPDNPAPEPEQPETDAKARLRAFEDEHFGPDCVRIEGQVERGSGSPFSQMSDDDKATYAALERLVVAEQKVADARAALAVAEEEYAAAESAADA